MVRSKPQFALAAVLAASFYSGTSYASVFGFGVNQPLKTAVKALVPANDHVKYMSGVDTSARLSWSGGKSWQTTLRSALMAKGLDYVRYGRTVHIYKMKHGVHYQNVDLVSSPGLTIEGSAEVKKKLNKMASGHPIIGVQFKSKHTPKSGHVPGPHQLQSILSGKSTSALNKTVLASINGKHESTIKPAKASSIKLASVSTSKMPPKAIPMPPPPPAHVWVLPRGTSLRKDIIHWGHEAGYKHVYWNIKGTLMIPQTITIHGTLVQALTKIGNSLAQNKLGFNVTRNANAGARYILITGKW